MFDPVSPQVSFPELDEKWLAFWDENRVFDKTIEGREGAPPFVFYEGPPTANGMPHAGHVLTRVMKDVFLRYRTMCGFYVPRRGGWDTHGLPVEVEVEKALGISGREAIELYGVEEFSKRCIESVFKYIDEWRRMTRRIGFWVDLDEAYATYHASFVESVWWALKSLFDQGLLYQGYKVVWWWPQGGTALSAGEVGQGYQTVDDPSCFVRFAIEGEENTSFLAWTTTPWTLPSNVALAIRPSVDYATVQLEDGAKLVLAAGLVEKVLGKDANVVATTKGSDLVGKRYKPLFTYATPEGGPSYVVIDADFVTLDGGTGIVHCAPAFGEDDFRVCKAKGLGFLQLLKPDGTFPPEVTDFAGRFCKEADRDIIRDLKKRGLLQKEEVYRHEYPYCWRKSSDPLIQYARRSWFVRTTQEISKVIENNQQVTWEPSHIKDGRMGQFLEGNVDWALSRERFWGTPLPIWVNDVTGKMISLSSRKEILAKNPSAFAAFDAAKRENPALSEDLAVHKPWIDQVTFCEPGEEGTYRRVPEVIDCWFDSGCMPFAQWGYPHIGHEEFARNFPADFITEAVDQTRGWFYSLLTVNTLLFPDQQKPYPFKNCVVLGLLNDEKGKKYSKSLKNYTDPLAMMERSGADGVRWALYTGTVPGQNTRFFEGTVNDAVRELLLKVWNVYSFFVNYANIDGFVPSAKALPVAERSEIDRYILAELDETVRTVRVELDQYKSHMAVKHLERFVDALSNWYVRRSRGRFWSGVDGNATDKLSAFTTLHEVLVDTAKLIAPFVPFLAETLYQNLVRTGDAAAPISIHLTAYPTPNDERRDDALRIAIDKVRDAITLGQRVRNDHKLKTRQPLGEAILVVADDAERAELERFSTDLMEELNVERVTFTQDPAKYVEFQLLPNFRALGPKLGQNLPVCKKALAEANGSALHAELSTTGKVVIQLPSGPIELGPEEVQIRLSAKEHFAAASEGGRVVVLDTQITDALKRAGLAREVVSRIQKARKSRDLAYDARIEVRYVAEGELAKAIEEHAAYIAGETLATSLSAGVGEGADEGGDVDGSSLALYVA
jgi:isoleucyl-tRNA synthetase